VISKKGRWFSSLIHSHGRGDAETAGHLIFKVARKQVVVIVATALCFESMPGTAAAQAPIVEATRVRVRTVQASGSRIEITLVGGTRLRGRVIRGDDDSFTLSEEKTKREVPLQYAQVIEVKKSGLSGNTKRAIALAVAGSVLVVLCFAPFPLGFLCQQDPS
jgi:hypothetical protein